MNKRKRVWRKLIHRYRLVILDADAYQEKFTVKLNRVNVFLIVGFGSLSLIALTTLLIAFTPLKAYIPGYVVDTTARRARLEELTHRADSIEGVMKASAFYFRNIESILKGDIHAVPVDSLAHSDTVVRLPDSAFVPTRKDSAFRSQIEQELRYDLTGAPKKVESVVLFAPVKGIVTDTFNIAQKHFAVDIAGALNDPVKAAADGTIVFAGWTADTGNTIVLQHARNVVTVYKHNAVLYKKEGDRVRAGAVIAAIGNSGELSSGPHLHFEIWIKGQPVDPLQYIDF